MLRKGLILLAMTLGLAGAACAGDDSGGGDDEGGGCAVECSADCSGGGFGLTCESGPVSYSESCSYSYGPTGGVSAVDCDGTLTFEASGNSYDYTMSWTAGDCRIQVDVVGVGSCTDPS